MGKYDTIIVESKLDIPYHYYAGKIVGKFYDELEDHHKICGIRCSHCNTVYMPPRETCGRCFEEMDQWVELKAQGVVTNYTVIRYEETAIQPMEPPYVQAMIKLDGADTAFIHLLGEVEPDKVAIGMRVTAVFSPKKTGDILNIKYFKPLI